MDPDDSPKNLFFTTNLKHLRKSQGLSQEAFAQKIALNRGNIVSYEKGAAEPNIRNLLRIADFFGVSIEDLIQVDFRNRVGLYQKGESIHHVPLLSTVLTETEVKVLVAKSQSLFAIIQGIGHYHALQSSEGEEEKTLTPEVIKIDIHRCIEVSDALVKINQQILQAINVDN